jgi:hypothetical protein
LSSINKKVIIYNYLLILKFKLNLLSLGLIIEKELKIEFNKKINIIDFAEKILTQEYISNNINTIKIIIKFNKNL